AHDVGGNRVTGNTCVGRGAGIAIFGYSWPVIEANHIIDNDTLLTEKTDGGGIAIVTAWFKPSIVTVSDANKLVNFEDNWDANGLKLAKDISSNYSSRIIKNRIAKNRARDDGGGIYMTNLATAFLHDNQILQNKAGNAGGGIRVTFGSLIIISGGEISQNVANTRRQIKAEKDADGNSLEPSLNKNGGGGLSVRNSSARLTGVKVEKNKVEDWAGGGIFFSAADAEAWYFKKALNKVFEISEVSLKIDSSSSVKLNHVTHEGDGLGKDHRKGGGLYVLRYKNDEDSVEGLPISIEVDDVDAVIGGNLQDQSSARPPLSVKSPSSKNLHIEDFYHRSGKPIDDSNKASFVKKKKLKYTSS
ncbi:MAG: right-handed parallel beta-helix repeat-containing protein, partial [Cyanobacteria bacterium P01_D01_bin.115]